MRYTAGLTHIILYSNIVDIIRVTYIIVCIPVFVIMIVKIITNKIPRPLCARCIFVSIFCIDKQNQCATKNPNRNQIKSAYQFWFIVNCIFFKWTTIILGNRVFCYSNYIYPILLCSYIIRTITVILSNLKTYTLQSTIAISVKLYSFYCRLLAKEQLLHYFITKHFFVERCVVCVRWILVQKITKRIINSIYTIDQKWVKSYTKFVDRFFVSTSVNWICLLVTLIGNKL